MIIEGRVSQQVFPRPHVGLTGFCHWRCWQWTQSDRALSAIQSSSKTTPVYIHEAKSFYTRE